MKIKTVNETIKFSLAEIAKATGTETEFLEGIAYGVVILKIPLANGKTLVLRQGDDKKDHEAIVI